MFVIGERINPAGRRALAQALRSKDTAFIQREAKQQEQAGAGALDVNVCLPDAARTELMRFAVESVRQVSALPVAVDDQSPDVVEAGLSAGGSAVMTNSPVDLARQGEAIIDLARRFESQMFVLPLDDGCVPETRQQFIQISRGIVKRLEAAGIRRDRLILDAAAMPLKRAKSRAFDVLDRIRAVHSEFGVRPGLALSNVSYGLNNRARLNAWFLKFAKRAAAAAVICSPLEEEVMEVVHCLKSEPIANEKRKFLEFAERCWT